MNQKATEVLFGLLVIDKKVEQKDNLTENEDEES